MINQLNVRHLEEKDIDLIADYWVNSDPEFLTGMGVDLQKIPDRFNFSIMLKNQLNTSIPLRQSHALIWEFDGKPIGHTNVNKIEFGVQAFMHLHLWQNKFRRKGMGTTLVRLSVPLFFRELELKILYCEPYSLNPAPNKTLEKAGFFFEKAYTTIPGTINFEQQVNRWLFKKEWL